MIITRESTFYVPQDDPSLLEATPTKRSPLRNGTSTPWRQERALTFPKPYSLWNQSLYSVGFSMAMLALLAIFLFFCSKGSVAVSLTSAGIGAILGYMIKGLEESCD